MTQPVPDGTDVPPLAEQPSISVFERLKSLLASHGTPADVTSHRPVFTSAEAAAVRGESLHSGAKALIVKADDRFVLLVLPGDHQLDSKTARKVLAAKSIRFATGQEVQALTGLKPGSIPPFGSLFGLKTYCDASLEECERINFNAGSHTESVRMKYADYVAVEKPLAEVFSRAGAPPG